MELLSFITRYMQVAQITDIIDIAIVSYIIYFVLKRIKGTSVYRLLKGLLFVLFAFILASTFNLNTIKFILENLTQVGLIALVIVFQPELRKILEKMGKAQFYKYTFGSDELSQATSVINEVVDACIRLSDAKEGALIVFEKEYSLNEIVDTGILINANVTSELIRNVFYTKAPLHDGALIIRDFKISAASCILPLSKNKNISKDLGTRHRAAVGMTEFSDAICVIVSEETGAISVSTRGMLKRHLSKDTLKKLLNYELVNKENSIKKEHIFVKIENKIAKIFKNFSKEG